MRLRGAGETRLRACLVCGAAGLGGAIFAIALVLITFGVAVWAIGATGVGGVAVSGHQWHVTLDDGAVLFYLAQLVSMSFFHHSAELRFAALPGLALVAVAIGGSAMVTVRLLGGSVGRRMLVVGLMAIAYASLAGFGARFLALSFTGPYIGRGTAMAPATVEAFVLPLIWGLLFASAGGLVGIFGRRWREETSRLLGAWAVPVAGSLRALGLGLSLAFVVTIVGGVVLGASSNGLRSIVSGDPGHLVAVLGWLLIALPTLVLGVFLSCFGVSFDWHVEALSRTQGSSSILGGALPSIGSSTAHDIPAALSLMLVLATVTVVTAGWVAARHSGTSVSLSIQNALRAGVLMTLTCWLFGLLTRVDAQAGGFLGLHLQADAGSLLWRAPLWCLLGSFTGSVAYVALRGDLSCRQLTAELPEALRAARARARRPGSWRRGLAVRAALSAGALALPAMLIGIGSAGASAPSQQAAVSLAPIRQAAEQRLRRGDVDHSKLLVTVDPNSRVVDSAIARIPLTTLGVSVTQSPVAKARAVLARDGSLFGASGQANELGEPEVVADPITNTKSVYFAQTIDGVPVFGNNIGVHFSRDGRNAEFINGSFLPDVTLPSPKAALTASQAVVVAKSILPAGKLVHPPRLEIYTGAPSHESGPTARLAWFVWLAAGPQNASNEYVVDANTGSILHVFVRAFYSETPDVQIDNAEFKTLLPGKEARHQGGAESTVKEVNNAYNDQEESFEFFSKLKREHVESSWYGYNSKGNEQELATVDYGKECKTTEWYPPLQEIVLCEDFAKAPDVVAHEYAAAVIEHSVNEVDEGESGAIAEGFADSMGEALESYKKTKGIEKPTKEQEEPESEWKYGAKAPEGPFRNLKEPTTIEKLESEGKKYKDPAKLKEYLNACVDSGGIHENATIIGHAFYELAQKIGVKKAANVFFVMQTEGLRREEHPELEQAERAAVAAAMNLYNESTANETKAAFETVELNGTNPTPTSNLVGCGTICTFEDALLGQEPAHGTASTLDMLATLYRARGELAQHSAAGRHFMPLYEANMGRITELVSSDPTLAETAVNGLAELSPALNALAEGKGQKFKLTATEMAKIEAALKRLAQDDRLISGGGTLAALIERELKWLRLASYAGMSYKAGFARLNAEVPPPTGSTLVDRNCTGTPYGNEFQIDAFTLDTPGHHKPGEVSPIESSGVACGAAVELVTEKTCEHASAPLNEKLTIELPPGDEIHSTAEMESGAYIGQTSGTALACAGDHSKDIYGVTGITAIKTWTAEECPTAAIACYKLESTIKEGELHGEGRGYGWVIKEGEKEMFVTGATKDTVEDEGERLTNVPVSIGQFAVKLCAHAGKPDTDTCGGASAPWIHKNGSESQPGGCSTTTTRGRYVATVTNTAAETSKPAWHCVYWGEYDHKQLVDEGKSLAAVSCVHDTTDCVVSDSSGNALYSKNVSATAASTWTSWSGATSPSEAIACPSTTLCVLGDGKATEGGGGDMYYATSLGGTWTKAFEPAHGVLATSCPSSSFCVSGQEGGRIRFATKPASTEWTEVTIGSGAVNGVDCVSASFCAAVNSTGDLYTATTEAHVKEAAGWKATDIDGSTALHGVACTSVSMCVAVDAAGDVITLTINGSGEVSESHKHDIDGTNSLTAASCVEVGICAAVDAKGNIFVSDSGGASWNLQHTVTNDLTSVSCASGELCVAADKEGYITAFAPENISASETQTIDSGNSINTVSCVPATTECAVADSKGNALYASGVSEIEATTWKSWSGPTSPSEAIACPTSTLCVLGDGHVEEGIGGNMYYATSLGGTWTKAFSPAFGVLAISCPSASLCVDAQEGGGFIRYATKPASTEWTSLSIGEGAMNAVSCLSSSFCAVVDGSGHVHVANTEAKIKEEGGWKATDIEGSTALKGIACRSTTACFVIDGTGNVLEVTINSSGEATATKEDIDGTNDLTAITCSEGVVCVAVDNKGTVFTWNTLTGSWSSEYMLGTDLTSVSCSTRGFCLAADTTGEVTAFEPE
jgi:Zn-dependent metalloprotease